MSSTASNASETFSDNDDDGSASEDDVQDRGARAIELRSRLSLLGAGLEALSEADAARLLEALRLEAASEEDVVSLLEAHVLRAHLAAAEAQPPSARESRSKAASADVARRAKLEHRATARTLALKGAWVECLAALDGGRLASSDGSSIIIWNLADCTQVAKLEGHTGCVYALAAIDGGRLATGGGQPKSMIKVLGGNEGDEDNRGYGELFIWNLADGEQLAKLEGHANTVWSLAALDGGRLASGRSNGCIIIWSVAEGTQLARRS